MMTEMTHQQRNRLLAVGDIHGCRGLLEELMEKVQPTEDDQVVFLGDYIDRGPDSKGTIEYLIDFGKRFPRTVFLKGNHEDMFLDYLADRDPLNFLLNGGEKTLESYGGEEGIPESHRRFLHGLETSFATDEFIFVHAGLRPGIPLEEQDEHDLIWIRGEFIHSEYDWGRTVVFGHTPQQEPLLTETRIGLDTGAVYGRYLTCCEVEQRRFWHAGGEPAKRRRFFMF
jgi:serine/threonine protein phosphatase 1